MRTSKYCFSLCILLCLSFFISCDNNDETIQTVMITFINESSYNAKVHRDSFYGPVIAEVNRIDRKTTVPVRVSDNDGTVFSIEYLVYPMNYSDIFVSCYDLNVQIKRLIKAGEPPILIPQPKNLVSKTGFIKIINVHNLPIEFRRAGEGLRQADNNSKSISAGGYGIYKFENIPDGGQHCQYYNIGSTFESIYFSDFIIQNDLYITKNDFIYIFEFDGNSIIKTGEQLIVFN